jgi:hypoxanthine phosphoribosyltransferase
MMDQVPPEDCEPGAFGASAAGRREPEVPEVGATYLSAAAIAARVTELGVQISRDYAGQEILLVGTLKGSIFFVADLARAITVPIEIDFLSLSSFAKEHKETGSKAIRFLKDLDAPIKDKNVIVVQDMIDSGLTLHYVYRSLALRRPRTLEACVLFDRPQLRLVDLEAKYVGFEVSDDFFVGYGFDYQQLYRNLPYVAYLNASPYKPALF